MNDVLRSLNLHVEVYSPLHIGSGERIPYKLLLLDDDSLTVVDEGKLIDWAAKDEKRSDRLVAFFEDPKQSLSDFLQQNRSISLQQVQKYQITNNAVGKGMLSEVLEFIKTSGAPYLPGSSVKGVLRSALIRGFLLESRSTLEQVQQKAAEVIGEHAKGVAFGKKSRAKPGGVIEPLVMVPNSGIKSGKYPNYDISRAIQLGDAPPVSPQSLQLSEVRLFSLNQKGALAYKGNFSIFAETIPLQTEFDLPMTINSYLFQSPAVEQLGFADRQALIGKLAGYCKSASNELIDQEIDFYANAGERRLKEFYENLKAEQADFKSAFFLPLGWGSGYDAKTITDLLGESTFQQVVDVYQNTQRLGKPSGSGAWLGAKRTPKSRKVAVGKDGIPCPLGWVKITLQVVRAA
ncbi:MAG: type III-A CRISPR-associated RAMP protein Csm5 [Anaerolineae bacterium]|nr:type III-A CRISPR-associated RAMP protein Csm5 [Anaerolineae bacterium]